MSTDLEREKLKGRQTVGLQILKAMFDETVGGGQDPETMRFSPKSISNGLQLELIDVILAFQYLEGEHLITCTSNMMDPDYTQYKLNHYGIVEVEQVIEYPEQRTEHFMLSVVQHFHSTVGNVQNGLNAKANVEQRTG